MALLGCLCGARDTSPWRALQAKVLGRTVSVEAGPLLNPTPQAPSRSGASNPASQTCLSHSAPSHPSPTSKSSPEYRYISTPRPSRHPARD